MNVGILLGQYVKQHDLGAVLAAETGFKILSNSDTVGAPDATFVRRERVEAVGEVEGYWPEAPDLAVEVVSQNDRFSEVEDKIADWLRAGTRMALVVNPSGRSVTARLPEGGVRILSDEEVLDGVEVVPGWTLPVSDLFG